VLPAPPSPIPDEAPSGAPAPPAPEYSATRSSTRVNWILAGATVAGCAYIALADPNSTASWYPQCPFRSLTGFDCPGCGITRALHAGLTGDPGRAFDHNALVIVMAVVGVVWFVVGRVRSSRGLPPLRLRHPARWGIGFGVVVAAFWVLRNVAWGPLEWLGSGASGV
jgi:hypothetical protein